MTIYNEISNWSKNFFMIPNNSAGKTLVQELAKLLKAFMDSGGRNVKAIYSFHVLPTLMLQKPTHNCSYQEASRHLRRRWELWTSGDLTSLMEEGKSMQKQSKLRVKNLRLCGEEDVARRFGNCMSSGRVRQAVRMLSETIDGTQSGVLHMEEISARADGSAATVRKILIEKHPEGQPAPKSILLSGEVLQESAIRFEAITAPLVQRIARQCQGYAGPSGLNAESWRRICSSYKGASTSMCQALANFARLLATESLKPESLVPFLSCRLIALDKRPGVRPIGVCKVARRIVSKAILKIV